MYSEECKNTDKKQCHRPEGIIENGEFLPVVMGCMGQVTGKPLICIFMAFLTGIDDIVHTDAGVGIIRWQDQVGIVTI